MPSNEVQQINPKDFNNIAKVANVEVTLCAELGRTKLSLKDAIEYDTGSIISLDKLTNDAVDIYVNDVLIARGSIVAIEDSYGVKIVEIIDNKSQNQEKE